MYFDRDGLPLDRHEWNKLQEDRDYQRIAQATLADGTWISTVWLGWDHGYGGGPLIFETMVFASGRTQDGTLGPDLESERYSTEAEARAGHEAMVRKWSTPAA